MRALLTIVLIAVAPFVAGCAHVRDDAAYPVRVALDTEVGTIVVEVYPDKSPVSAGDFLRHVDDGLYRNAGFYRVVRPENDRGTPTITVIQGGRLDAGNPSPGIEHETTRQTGLRHVDGALSVARADPGTGSARAFFISIGAQPSLDYGGLRNPDGQGFAVFGRVINGMEIVRSINVMNADGVADNPYVEGQILPEPVRIKSARRVD